MMPQPDPGISRKLGQFVSFCSVLSVAFGLWVLTGWMFHIQIMKNILPGQVAVKANTAACFVLIGFALWFLKKEQLPFASGWKLAAQIAAVMASVVGLLSLTECIWGWDLGIDRLLFAAGSEDIPGSVRPGLMSPITAFGFLSFGPALLLLNAKSTFGRSLAQFLPCGAAIASIFGILDFVLDANTTHTYISPATASVLFLFAFALLFACQHSRLGALVASATLGGTLTRRLVPVVILVPLVVGWLRWRGQASGLYSDWTGVALMTVCSIVALSALTVWTGFAVDRSERQRRQGEESINRLAAIVTSSNDAIIGKTIDGVVISWNPGAEAIYGYSAQEIIGQSISITVPSDRREEFATLMERIRQGQRVNHYETMRVRKDGKSIHVALSVSPVKDQSGNIVGSSTIARDITERKRAENELRKASLYARSLLEASLDPLVTISKNGKIMDVNRATERATGVERKALIGSDFSNYFTDPQKARCGYEEVFAQGFVHDYPLALRSREGKVTDVLYNATVFKNEAGEVEGVFAAARDVTERKRAEFALQESETKFRALSELVPQLVWACTADGLNVYFSQRWVEYTGLTLEESYGRGWNTPFHPDDKQPAWNAWNHAVATGDTYRIDCRLRAADGSYRWFLIKGVPLRDAAGQIVKWYGTCTDIDDLKRAEKEIRMLNQELEQRVEQRTAQLHESERRVRRKLESILSPEGDLGHLELGDLLDIPAVQSLVGDFYELAHIPMFILDLKGSPLVAAGWQEICTKFHRADPEACKHCQDSDRELSTGVAPGEFKLYKCKNNLWDVVTPIRVGDQQVGNLFSGQFFFTDETVDRELFRSQARKYGFDEQEYLAALDRVPRLSRAEVDTGMTFYIKFAQLLSQLSYSGIKLARSVSEIGRVNAELAASVKELEAFTYSVSHDLRAPLRHISGFSKILTEEYGSSLPTDAQHHLQRIQEGTRRMGLLVDDLLNLARVGRRDLSLRVTGLKSVIDEVIAELAPECAGRQIEWKIGNLPFVECDPGLIKQVFQNLLSNAVKFTRPRPQAVIEIGQQEERGNSVVFVRDNGVGFSMKYADKLFGVFQRLHRPEDFEGTGVGLAVVQRIVQKHGGRIWAEAELGKGATFYFTLGGSEKIELKTKAAIIGDQA